MAANPQEYLLSFDFESITRQVDQINSSYANLGETLKGITDKLSEDLKGIEESSSRILDNLGFIVQSIKTSSSAIEYNTSKALQNYKDLDDVTKRISENLKSFPGSGIGAVQSTYYSDSDSKEEEKSYRSVVSNSVKTLSEKAGNLSDNIGSSLEKSFKGFSKDFNNTISNGVKSLAASIGMKSFGGAGGGFGSTSVLAMFALAAFGATREMQLDAQRGQLKNVVESARDFYSKDGEAAYNWFAGVQEQLRLQANVSVEETNKVMGAFVNMGYSIKQALKGSQVEASIENLNTTIATTSISMDLVFKKGIGFFAGEIAKAATDFNYTLTQSEDKLKKLYFMAQRTGAGIEGFITGIMGAAQSMKQFGIDIEQVATVANRVQSSYKEMGLESQKAGDLAVSGIQALLEGAKRMFTDKNLFAEYHKIHGGGKDFLTFFQEEQDTVARLAKGDPAAMFKMIGGFRDVLMSMSGEDLVRFREIGMTKFAVPDVAILSQLFQKPEMFTKPGQMGKLTAAQQKALDQAGKTKTEELTELQKVQRDLIEHLGKIGMMILKALVALVRIFADLGKTLIALPDIIGADEGTRTRILSELSDNLTTSLKVIGESFSNIPSELGALGSDLGPHIEKILDPSGVSKEYKDYNPSDIVKENLKEQSIDTPTLTRVASTVAKAAAETAISLVKRGELPQKDITDFVAEEFKDEIAEELGLRKADKAKGGVSQVRFMLPAIRLRYSTSISDKAIVPLQGQ